MPGTPKRCDPRPNPRLKLIQRVFQRLIAQSGDQAIKVGFHRSPPPQGCIRNTHESLKTLKSSGSRSSVARLRCPREEPMSGIHVERLRSIQDATSPHAGALNLHSSTRPSMDSRGSYRTRADSPPCQRLAGSENLPSPTWLRRLRRPRADRSGFWQDDRNWPASRRDRWRRRSYPAVPREWRQTLRWTALAQACRR